MTLLESKTVLTALASCLVNDGQGEKDVFSIIIILINQIGFAGQPTTVVDVGTSAITEEPAPIMASLPIFISWIMQAPIPTQLLAPRFTAPDKFAPGLT